MIRVRIALKLPSIPVKTASPNLPPMLSPNEMMASPTIASYADETTESRNAPPYTTTARIATQTAASIGMPVRGAMRMSDILSDSVGSTSTLSMHSDSMDPARA